MAEERTLGLARAPVTEGEPSKQELQLRMEEARDSISQTVTEIKDTVTHQYEAVKDALDWREHFKKRPVAWSLGAAGVGFFVGYGIAAAIKDDDYENDDYVSSVARAYVSQPITGQSHRVTATPALATAPPPSEAKSNGADEGPGLIERFKETRAFDRLQQEVGSLGDRLVDELATTAQVVVVPALIRKVREWLGADLSDETSKSQTPAAASMRSQSDTSYRPTLERNPS